MTSGIVVPLLLAVAAFVAVSVTVLYVQSRRTARAQTQARSKTLDTYGTTEAEPLESDTTQQEPRVRFPRLAGRLDSAGIAMDPQRWVICQVAGAAVLSLILAAIIAPLPGIILGIFTGWLVPRLVLRARANSRQRAFEAQLPEFLLVIAGSLQVGLPLDQALESASEEGDSELSRQMRRAVAETRMGTPLDRALSAVAERMNSEDLRWAVIALGIQREVGGNLSQVLQTVAGTIRAREELRGEVRTLSAEGRLSAYVLIALPILMFLLLVLIRREYVQILWTEPIGYFMLALFVVLISVGWVWMRRVITVKV